MKQSLDTKYWACIVERIASRETAVEQVLMPRFVLKQSLPDTETRWLVKCGDMVCFGIVGYTMKPYTKVQPRQ